MLLAGAAALLAFQYPRGGYRSEAHAVTHEQDDVARAAAATRALQCFAEVILTCCVPGIIQQWRFQPRRRRLIHGGTGTQKQKQCQA